VVSKQLTTGEAVLQFDVVQQSTLSLAVHVAAHDFTRVPDVISVLVKKNKIKFYSIIQCLFQAEHY
jgi:hypothetical protein